MENLLSLTSRPGGILFFRIFGLCLLLTGLFTAMFEVNVGGITPTIWILVGLGSFLGAICNTLFAIRKHLETGYQKK